MQFTSVRNVLNKYSVRTPVKHRKTAVYSHNRTVSSQDFVSTAFLRYGAYPYSAVFCTAIAIYGTVVSPTRVYHHMLTPNCIGRQKQRLVWQHTLFAAERHPISVSRLAFPRSMPAVSFRHFVLVISSSNNYFSAVGRTVFRSELRFNPSLHASRHQVQYLKYLYVLNS